MIYKCMNRGMVGSDLTMPSRFCLQDWWSIPHCGPDSFKRKKYEVAVAFSKK